MKKYLDDVLINTNDGNTISVIANFDRGDLETDEPKVEDMDIPILPLRNMMLFPGTLLPVNIARDSAKKLLEDAQDSGTGIGVFSQLRENIENPTNRDLFSTGVLGRVVKLLKLPDGTHTAFIQGYSRIQLLEAHSTDRYMMGKVAKNPEETPSANDRTFRVTVDACKEVADRMLQKSDGVKIDAKFSTRDIQDRVFYINFLCASMPVSNKEHMRLLMEDDLRQRAIELLKLLKREEQFAQLKASIQMQTQSELNQQQREYFLRKEMENIKDELGQGADDEVAKFRARLNKDFRPLLVKERIEKEIDKLDHMAPQSAEYSVQYEYIETLLSLPWLSYNSGKMTIKNAEKILNADHYGMELVKERILEHLAVIKTRGDFKAPIICLYGPPGVGKTSLGKSIARAMDRKYVRVSLGGLHDESEIRGHRKTYVGAMPGRIIKGILEAKSSCPVFILDEIDKVSGADIHGDPSSAMLEVLDPEQNERFHDNYLDMDYDLSNVMFVATANNIGTIPPPLLDRMELIEVSGYLTEEKIEIAKRHLIPDALEDNGMSRKRIKFSKQAIEKIIEDYTRESGVRELKKQIEKVIRKILLEQQRESEEERDYNLKPEDIVKYLGTEKFSRDKYQDNEYAGVVTGLAWTAVGGEILFVETSLSKGKGSRLTLTGNLGDVMKESAVLALEYIKAHADRYGIDSSIFENWNIHIHVPEGAVPKDGPSAGITIATSIISALTQRKVRKNLAMTGEITLRGKVLPVGGIKEKILAAKRAGITDIMLCYENEKNIKDIPEKYVKGVTFHYVKDVNEVFDFALLDEKVKGAINFSIKDEKSEKGINSTPSPKDEGNS